MMDISTKRALEVAKFHEVSEELYADNPEDSGLRAMHHISANLLRALAAERDALRAALSRAKKLFLQDEPQKAFIELCAALGEKE